MSWGNYHQGQSGGHGDQQGQDPWGRTYQPDEPTGYVTNDPYAPPNYNQQQYHQQAGGPYGQPYGAPYQYARPGMMQFAYDAVHPPRPSVGFVRALRLFFKNYAVFHGRASRSEFWWMALWGAMFYVAVGSPMALSIWLSSASGGSDFPPLAAVMLVIMGVGWLATVLPTIALQVRRLHDAGFSGFFALLAYIPYVNYVGGLVPFIMSFFPSTPSGVKYDNPMGAQPAVD